MASGVGIQTLTETQDSWGGLADIFMPILKYGQPFDDQKSPMWDFFFF